MLVKVSAPTPSNSIQYGATSRPPVLPPQLPSAASPFTSTATPSQQTSVIPLPKRSPLLANQASSSSTTTTSRIERVDFVPSYMDNIIPQSAPRKPTAPNANRSPTTGHPALAAQEPRTGSEAGTQVVTGLGSGDVKSSISHAPSHQPQPTLAQHQAPSNPPGMAHSGGPTVPVPIPTPTSNPNVTSPNSFSLAPQPEDREVDVKPDLPPSPTSTAPLAAPSTVPTSSPLPPNTWPAEFKQILNSLAPTFALGTHHLATFIEVIADSRAAWNMFLNLPVGQGGRFGEDLDFTKTSLREKGVGQFELLVWGDGVKRIRREQWETQGRERPSAVGRE
ncbi:hypothetical protein T439DRAFT_43490 [Meredithblackwellia eburnea MCA 4105]